MMINKYDIVRMGQEAGLLTEGEAWVSPYQEAMERFAALVAAAEREACAKVCESQMPNPVQNWADAQIVNALRDCAAAIRARSNT